MIQIRVNFSNYISRTIRLNKQSIQNALTKPDEKKKRVRTPFASKLSEKGVNSHKHVRSSWATEKNVNLNI